LSSDGIMDCLKLFQKHTQNLTKGTGDQWRSNCPFHSEKTKKNKSFSVNMDTGKYYCHSCGAKGNAITFAIHFGESTYAYHNNNNLSGYQKLEIDNVFKYHKQLLDNLEYALPFWNTEIINLLKIGLNIDKENIVFPIFNERNEIINVKQHHGSQFKGASATLYPLQLLSKYEDSYIIITEGEKDVVSLLSQGISAATSTGGARVITNDISQLLRFKKIYICLDNDDPGDAGTDLWIKKIRKLNPKSNIRVCDLSRFVDDGGDISDYFSIEDKSQQSFIDEVIDKSVWARLPGTDVPIYIKQLLMSDTMSSLNFRDQIVFFHLVHRAARYTFKTSMINGMRVRMRPGEFITSYDRFAKLCGKGMTAKMVIRATDTLVSLELIRKENLKRKMGMKFIIRNWVDENGHSESHSDSHKTVTENIKYLSPEELLNKLNNGHSE